MLGSRAQVFGGGGCGGGFVCEDIVRNVRQTYLPPGSDAGTVKGSVSWHHRGPAAGIMTHIKHDSLRFKKKKKKKGASAFGGSYDRGRLSEFSRGALCGFMKCSFCSMTAEQLGWRNVLEQQEASSCCHVQSDLSSWSPGEQPPLSPVFPASNKTHPRQAQRS